MSWSAGATRGYNSTATTGTTVAVNPSANLTVGKVVWALCISDNVTASDAATTDHSVDDDQGNSWALVYEWTEGADGVGAGLAVSMWMTQITTQIGTGDNVTLTVGSSCDVKIIGLHEATTGLGGLPTVADVQKISGLGFGVKNATISGLSSQEYFWIGVCASEYAGGAITQDTDYSNCFDTTRRTIGSGNTGMAWWGGYRIYTGAGDSYGPDFATNADFVVILAAIKENAAAGGSGVGDRGVDRGVDRGMNRGIAA